MAQPAVQAHAPMRVTRAGAEAAEIVGRLTERLRANFAVERAERRVARMLRDIGQLGPGSGN